MKLFKKSKLKDFGFVDKVGVELEGRWDNVPNMQGLGSFYGDGSVEFDCECDGDNYHEHNDNCYDEDNELNCGQSERDGGCCCDDQIGEIGSKPMKIDEILDFTNKYYPDETNTSCGLHIHVSFNSRLSYMQLMTKKFYDYFLERSERWGKYNHINKDSSFWERLKGENHYCERKFQPHMQCHTQDKSEYRYTHLNYCFPLFNTLECRMFPCFQKKELSLKAIELFYDVCNSWLKKPLVNRAYNGLVVDNENIEKRIEEIICAS